MCTINNKLNSNKAAGSHNISPKFDKKKKREEEL